MGRLTELATELLHCQGAVVEPVGSRAAGDGPGELEALLPENLAARLGLPEHVLLAEGAAGESAVSLAYGSELVERMVAMATENVPLAQSHLPLLLPGASDATSAALERYTGLNCVLRPAQVGPEEMWSGYLVLDYRYVADADERREGLVRVVVHEEVGAHIPSLIALETHSSLQSGPNDLQPPSDPRAVLARAGLAARHAVKEALVPLGASIHRRHLRDRARLRSYYGELRAEMERRLRRMEQRGAGEEELAARRAKVDSVGPELERKLAELRARYRLRVELRPVAAHRVGIRVRRVTLQMKRRQVQADLHLFQNAATRTFDPLVCQACGASIFAFALCDDRLHRLCDDCHRRRASARHCPVCERG